MLTTARAVEERVAALLATSIGDLWCIATADLLVRACASPDGRGPIAPPAPPPPDGVTHCEPPQTWYRADFKRDEIVEVPDVREYDATHIYIGRFRQQGGRWAGNVGRRDKHFPTRELALDALIVRAEERLGLAKLAHTEANTERLRQQFRLNALVAQKWKPDSTGLIEEAP
jgi:hypothetical protein